MSGNSDVQTIADEALAEETPAMPSVVADEEFEGGLIPSVSVNESEANRQAAESEEALARQAVEKSQATVRALASKLGVADPEALQQLLATATGALQAEIQALRAELSTVQANVRAGSDGMFNENDGHPGGYPWQLYRFPKGYGGDNSRDGWLAILPGGASPKSGNRDAGSYTRYLKKGLIPVGKYGPAPVPTTPRAADVFLHFLSKFPGFAGEFPASQVVAYNWHVAPPVRGLKFAQYEAVQESVVNYVCEACGDPSYFMPDDREAGPAYLRHLVNGHKYDFRTAAEAVRNAFDLNGKPVKLSVSAYRPAGTIEDAMKNSRPQ